LIDEVEFLRRQLQIDKEKMHLLEETMENLKNQGLINAGKHPKPSLSSLSINL
jgi:hypothetical protein